MDNKSLKLLLEVHKDLPQEGPGSTESTLKALSCIKDSIKKPNILDIGCGPGRQTIDLAQKTKGKITAIDLLDQYLKQLNTKINELQLETNIKTIKGFMEELPFDKNKFDLIWSEGAIYLMGFKEGLSYWKQFLKDNGCLAVTEISWLKDDPPQELKKFWDEGYPAMQNIQGNINIIKDCGYKLINHFTLPESDWWQYFHPLQQRIEMLKKDCTPELLEYIKSEETEVELYKKYSDYYSYEFYIMRK